MRIVVVNPRTGRRSVHARGFDEPVGLAGTRSALYVADFHGGLVRRVGADRSVTTLARLPQVTAVAVSPSGSVHAVTIADIAKIDQSSQSFARVDLTSLYALLPMTAITAMTEVLPGAFDLDA